MKEGNTSIRKLGAYLEENRFKTPSGKDKWGVSSVQSLLKVIDDAENDAPIETGTYKGWYEEKKTFCETKAESQWQQRVDKKELMPNGNWDGKEYKDNIAWDIPGRQIPEGGYTKGEFIEIQAHSWWVIGDHNIRLMMKMDKEIAKEEAKKKPKKKKAK